MSPAAERDETLEQLEDTRKQARALQERLETLVGKMGALWTAEDDRVLVLAHQRDEARAEVDRVLERNVELHNVNAAAQDVIDRLQGTCTAQAREVRRLRALLAARETILSGTGELVQPDPAGDLTDAELLRARGARAGKWFARLVAEVVRRRAEERLDGRDDREASLVTTLQVQARQRREEALADAARQAELVALNAKLADQVDKLRDEHTQLMRTAAEVLELRRDLADSRRETTNALIAGAELALSHIRTEDGELDMSELEPMGDEDDGVYALHPADCGGFCEWSCGAFIITLGPPDPDNRGRRPVLRVDHGTLTGVRA